MRIFGLLIQAIPEATRLSRDHTGQEEEMDNFIDVPLSY